MATFPLIGNYGVPPPTKDPLGLPAYYESDRIHVSGLVVADYSETPNHWQSSMTLSEWLIKEEVPAIFGVDTRALTKILRVKGCEKGKIIVSPPAAEKWSDARKGDTKDKSCKSKDDLPFIDVNAHNLVANVSTKTVTTYGDGALRVVAFDCGIKAQIVRDLVARGASVTVVPWDHDISMMDYDGIFVSNGPGDPAMAQATIESLRRAMEKPKPKPIFGICLGNQVHSPTARRPRASRCAMRRKL